MSDLRDLYQEVILDHNRSPRNFGPLEGADLRADGHNPLCGDRLSIAVKVEDGVVTDVRFEGSGCAISKASASLMTERIKGQTLDDARALVALGEVVLPELALADVATGIAASRRATTVAMNATARERMWRRAVRPEASEGVSGVRASGTCSAVPRARSPALAGCARRNRSR